MRRKLVAIILATIFCFLAYLEAVAQEITLETTAEASLSEQVDISISGLGISQTIDWALEIICAERVGGELKFINGIPVCAGRDHD